MNEAYISENPEDEEKLVGENNNAGNISENTGGSENKPDINPDSPDDSSGDRFQEFFTETVETDKPKMTETLKIFLQLREVDEELFEIEEEKGDLPENIDSIKSKMESLEVKLKKKTEDQSETDEERARLIADNVSYEEKINKYDEQKYDVRSNNEYDEIIKTIEGLFEEVKKNEIRISEIDTGTGAIKDEIISLVSKLEELKTELDEKQNLLNELNEQFKQEDVVLNDKRTALTSKLDAQSKALYERINKMHKGEATAIVRKSNCSGCYNSIPPQRVIEIKAAENIYTCQSCGRILISEELVSS